MPRKPTALPLRLYLFQASVDESGVWNPDKQATQRHLPGLGVEFQNLAIAAQSVGAPKWAALLKPHVDDELDDLFSAIASAALVLCADERLFAVTFGNGRHLLNLENVEFDFGLKVVLNSVEPTKLRSVDAKTIDEYALQTRRNIGRDSALRAFGLDVTQDVVRGVSGTPRETDLITKMAGADVLSLNARIPPHRLIDDLPNLCSQLLIAYEQTRYREHFEFIDHLRPEKSPAKLSELDEILVGRLNSGDRDQLTDIHLAAPDIVDALVLEGYKYRPSGRREPDSDPRITTYLEIRAGETLTLETLKTDRLIAWSAVADAELEHWSIYRSLVFEIELDGSLFALSGGKWFRVDVDYKERVYAEVSALAGRTDLPRGKVNWDEAEYNVHAAQVVSGACMDKQLVRDGGGDSIELCDVLAPEGALIHIKKRGSSSTLSHLFLQATNSAERLLQDPEFRKQARSRIRKIDKGLADLVPLGRPQATSFEIGLVVLTRSKRTTPFTLPFFSVVSLRQAVRRLDALGFRVTVTAVEED